MTIQNVSFGHSFRTREVANIVAGKQNASGAFLSKITGIPEGILLTNNDSDMFVAGSSYCAGKIAETHPEFEQLRDTSKLIAATVKNVDILGRINMKELEPLIDKREVQVKEVCKKLGDIVDIPSFEIPFLKG